MKISLVLIVLLSAGCTTVPRGEISNRMMNDTASLKVLKMRAEYELQCDDLTFTALNKFGVGANGVVSGNSGAQIGADGCGKRGVYVKAGADWLLNSGSKSDGW